MRSRTIILITLLVLGGLTIPPLGVAGAATVSGPISETYTVSPDLSCAYTFRNGANGFAGNTGCATFVMLTGELFGPAGFPPADLGQTPFTPISQEVETESDGDLTIRTRVALGQGGVTMTQIDTLDTLYGGLVSTELRIDTTNAPLGTYRLDAAYRVADCALANDTMGVGEQIGVGYNATYRCADEAGDYWMALRANSPRDEAGEAEAPAGMVFDAIRAGSLPEEGADPSVHDTAIVSWYGPTAFGSVGQNLLNAEFGMTMRGPEPTDPGPSPSPTTSPSDGENRLFANERIGTAIAISADAWPDLGADSVVIARHDNYPDSLAGSALAAATGGPLLLTPSDGLWAATGAELQRVLPPNRTVYLTGGTVALSEAVAQDIRDLGYLVNRKSGPSRYDTSVAIAESVISPPTIFVADGNTFADALVAGSVAAHTGGVVVLSNGSELPTPVRNYVDRFPTTPRYAIGPAAAAAFPEATPVAGTDVYATSRIVADTFYDGPTGAAIASGENFPDGLAGGAHAGMRGFPLLLSPQAGLPQQVMEFLAGDAPFEEIILYGGPAALSDLVAEQARAYVG